MIYGKLASGFLFAAVVAAVTVLLVGNEDAAKVGTFPWGIAMTPLVLLVVSTVLSYKHSRWIIKHGPPKSESLIMTDQHRR